MPSFLTITIFLLFLTYFFYFSTYYSAFGTFSDPFHYFGDQARTLLVVEVSDGQSGHSRDVRDVWRWDKVSASPQPSTDLGFMARWPDSLV